MGRLRGSWAPFRDPGGRLVPVMPTYHPAFLLRAYTEENRAKVWDDLRPWPGIYKGVMQNLGVYVYVFRLKLFGELVTLERKGSVTLIR